MAEPEPAQAEEQQPVQRWQNPMADRAARQAVLNQILTMLRAMREQNQAAQRRMSDVHVLILARGIEVALYRAAPSLEAYTDAPTLQARAHEYMEVARNHWHMNVELQPAAMRAIAARAAVLAGAGVQAPTWNQMLRAMAEHPVSDEVFPPQLHRTMTLWLRHATTCRSGAACFERHCRSAKGLALHMTQCAAGGACPIPSCRAGHQVIRHVRACRARADCEQCGPLWRARLDHSIPRLEPQSP